MRNALPIAILVGAMIASQASAGACVLQKIDITPLGAENADTYHGISGGLEVLFRKDVRDHAVKLFPEPPMTLRRLEPASECLVSDGGVWGRCGLSELTPHHGD
jgi:hypothetical protein